MCRRVYWKGRATASHNRKDYLGFFKWLAKAPSSVLEAQRSGQSGWGVTRSGGAACLSSRSEPPNTFEILYQNSRIDIGAEEKEKIVVGGAHSGSAKKEHQIEVERSKDQPHATFVAGTKFRHSTNASFGHSDAFANPSFSNRRDFRVLDLRLASPGRNGSTSHLDFMVAVPPICVFLRARQYGINDAT